MRKELNKALLLAVVLGLVGCGSEGRKITPEEEAAWRHPPKGNPPAYYHGAAVGPAGAPGPPPSAPKPPGSK